MCNAAGNDNIRMTVASQASSLKPFVKANTPPRYLPGSLMKNLFLK